MANKKFQGQRRAAQQSGQTNKKRLNRIRHRSESAHEQEVAQDISDQSVNIQMQSPQSGTAYQEYIVSDLMKTAIFAVVAFVVLVVLSIIL